MTLAQRILARLHASPVPVRTAVLTADLGARCESVWAALLRLERAGRVARTSQTGEVLSPGTCACCGRPLPYRRRSRHSPMFWVRVLPQ